MIKHYVRYPLYLLGTPLFYTLMKIIGPFLNNKKFWRIANKYVKYKLAEEAIREHVVYRIKSKFSR